MPKKESEEAVLAGWKFKPWRCSKLLMPPEHENWVWQAPSKQSLIAHRVGNELIDPRAGTLIAHADECEPLHPYIDSSNLPSLYQMQEGEICIDVNGKRVRHCNGRAEVNLNRKDDLWEGYVRFKSNPRVIPIIFRPHAKDFLEMKWPTTLNDLPKFDDLSKAVFAQVEGMPVTYIASDGTILPNGTILGNEYMPIEIDTDDDGVPIILGTLIGAIGDDR